MPTPDIADVPVVLLNRMQFGFHRRGGGGGGGGGEKSKAGISRG
jgi:hypothetical protein